jgi:heat shock protein HslJ
LSGSAGCNNYSAAYEVNGGEMTIGPAASTMMACQSPPGIMEQEGLYLEALGLVAGYRIQGSKLELTNAEGKTKITYTEVEPTSLVGTTWVATHYNNGKGGVTTLLAGTEITAVFGEDGTVAGSASCNNYSAGYEVSGDSISIGPAATTRMMCSEPEGIMEQENAYLAALQSAATYRIEGERLEMWDSGGAKQTDYVVAETASGPPDRVLANVEYQSQFTASGTAPLQDGEYREQAAPGSATETVVMLTDYVAYGDLNGQQAAAVILVTDPGGSGTFYDLAVVVEKNGQPANIATTLLGDRVQINSVTIEGNEIIVDMVQQGPDDPMCCPTQHVVKTYSLEGNELVETSSKVVG